MIDSSAKIFLIILTILLSNCSSHSNVSSDIDSSLLVKQIKISNDTLHDTSDSFSKYSLPLKLFRDDLKGGSGGTCFFIKYISKYYLITCWHALSCRNASNSRLIKGYKRSQHKTAVIQFDEKGNPHRWFIELYNSKGENLYYEKKLTDTSYLDITALEVPKDSILLSNYFTIDKIDTESNYNRKYSVLYYGYPTNYIGEQNLYPTPYKGVILDFKTEKLNNYISTDQFAYGGCSGSPLLLNSKGRYKLIGVVCSSPDITYKPTTCIDIKSAIALIESRKK